MNKAIVFVVVVALGINTQCHADSIKLKSGETIYGEIVSDNGTVVRMRVPNAAGTIFSLQDFPRTNIVAIGRSTDPEVGMEEAFQNFKRYKLVTYSYQLAYYDNVISNVLLKFLNAYPQSAHCAEIRDALTAWTSERDKVAEGSVKYNNQWYQGEEAKKVFATIQATQWIAEADRQLAAGQYESAIGQFQKALQQRPITQDTISTVETKCEYAFTKWTASASSGTSNPAEAEMESRRRAIARLQAQLEQNSGRISGIEQAQAIVSSAKFNHLHGRRCPNCKCTQGHWIASNGQDFGSTLPAVDTISLAGLRKLALQAQEEIARHNAAITTLQSGKSSTALALESIQNLRTQLVTETANAKASLLEQPIGIEVASAAANTRMVQAAANPPPESVQTAQRTESRPRVAQETIPQSPQRTAPQSPKPWWQEFWYLIVIGIVGTIYILRH